MSSTIEATTLTEDERRLEKTQNIREKIIDALSAETIDILNVAKDKDLSKIILTSMKDMDSQILARKKIEVETKANETNAAMIAQIARQMAENNYRANGSTDYIADNSGAAGRIPVPDLTRFSGVEPVEGEMVQEENNTDVDSFMSIHSKKARKANEIDRELSGSMTA